MYFLSGVACNFWRDGTKCGRPNSLFLCISFPFISFIQSFMYLFHTCSQTWRWACENDGLLLSPISRTKGDITSAHQHCLHSYGVMNKWQILQDFFFCLKKCCVLKKITVWYMSYVLFLLSDLRVFVCLLGPIWIHLLSWKIVWPVLSKSDVGRYHLNISQHSNQNKLWAIYLFEYFKAWLSVSSLPFLFWDNPTLMGDSILMIFLVYLRSWSRKQGFSSSFPVWSAFIGVFCKALHTTTLLFIFLLWEVRNTAGDRDRVVLGFAPLCCEVLLQCCLWSWPPTSNSTYETKDF